MCLFFVFPSQKHSYKILLVRSLKPRGMIIDRPPLPPPAAKHCKICILSKQINPLILGNDSESMATEPMFICGNTMNRVPGRWKVGVKKKGLKQEEKNECGFCSPWCFCHHGSPFSVGPDLQNRSERDKKKKRQNIKVIMWLGRLYPML